MNDNDRNHGNYIFLAGLIQTGGVDSLKKWVEEQPQMRQDYVLELLENLSKDISNLLQESRKPKTMAMVYKFPTKFKVINGKKA